MPKNENKQRVAKQKLIASWIKVGKSFFNDLVKGLTKDITTNEYDVKVLNPDTELVKEVAKNTRGVKGKLDKLIGKKFDSKKIEDKLDKIVAKEIVLKSPDVNIDKIEVQNLDELKDLVKEPKVSVNVDEVKVKNIADATKNLKKIEVSNLKDIKLDNSSLVTSLNSLKTAVLSIQKLLPSLKPDKIEKIEIKKLPKVELKDKKVSIKEIKQLTDALQGIRDDLAEVHKVIDEKEMGGQVGGGVIGSRSGPSNIQINGLRGLPLSTAVTVGSSIVQLPAKNLANRRSLIVYNNSSNTIELIGFNQSYGEGLPVLGGSYSPPIDAGQNMNIYAIANTSGNDVRCYEVSSEKEGA